MSEQCRTCHVRQRQTTIVSGMLGFGLMLAGAGPAGAIAGALLGGLLGWWFEQRRAAAPPPVAEGEGRP